MLNSSKVSAVEQWAAKRENSSLHHKAPFCGFFSALFYTDWALEESRGKKIVGKSRQERLSFRLIFQSLLKKPCPEDSFKYLDAAMAIFNRLMPILSDSYEGSGMLLSGSAGYRTFFY